MPSLNLVIMACGGTEVEVAEVEELELSSSRAGEEAANGVDERDGADAELGSTIVDVEGNSELSVGGRGSTTFVGGGAKHNGGEGGSPNEKVFSSKTLSATVKIIPVRRQ